MKKRFLCKIGFHDWIKTGVEFYSNRTMVRFVRCKCCGKESQIEYGGGA